MAFRTKGWLVHARIKTGEIKEGAFLAYCYGWPKRGPTKRKTTEKVKIDDGVRKKGRTIEMGARNRSSGVFCISPTTNHVGREG